MCRNAFVLITSVVVVGADLLILQLIFIRFFRSDLEIYDKPFAEQSAMEKTDITSLQKGLPLNCCAI